MHNDRSFLKTSAIVLSAVILASAVQAKSSLWKASSENGSLYIQGSLHLLTAENYPLAPAIEEAYAKSDALVLEADMQDMLAPEAQQLIMSKAMLSGDMTLEKSLSPQVYAELSKQLNAAGLPVDAMQNFKPWFAALTLVQSKMKSMGFSPALGLDHYFYNKAAADGKTIIGLETAVFQINLFDSLAEGNQDTYLKRMFKELALFESQLTEILTAWKTGDSETLGELMHESFKEYPELYGLFVVERNKTWAKKLAEMADPEKTLMVVVGSAHLPGEGGLLELLRAKGYTLEQL